MHAEWMALAHELSAPPFATPGVVAAAHRTDGIGRLRLFSRADNGHLDGLFAVHRQRSLRASGLQKLLSSRSGPIARSHDIEVQLLLEAAHDTGRLIEVSELDGGKHDIPRLVSDLLDNGCVVEATELYRSPLVELAPDRDAQRAALSRKRRQSLDRSRRRLDELGEVRFEMVDTSERAVDPASVDSLLRLEAQSWKGKRGSAITSTRRSETYFRSVMDWAEGEKILHLNQLHVGDQLVAASFALCIGTTLYGMKTAYEERFRKHGPGLLLLQEEILYSIDRGLRRLDLLGPVSNHKNDFANGERTIWQLSYGLRRTIPLAQLKVGGPLDQAARSLGFRSRQVRSGLRRRPGSDD